MSYLGNPLSTVDFPVDYFTGDGTSTTFQLSRIPASATSILVHIGGVKQVASTTDPAYYLDGSKLVFVSPPGAYSPIEVNYLGIAGQVNIPGVQSVTQDMLSLQLANTFVYQTTANGATASFTLNAPPVSANSLVVSANGVVQYDYSVNGNNLTFGFTPPVGTFIRVTSLALAQAGVPADGSVTSVKLGANLTITGNTTFDGFAGNPARIRGDFSNATTANRLAFQTSTTNSNSNLYLIPNGTATTSQWVITNSSDLSTTSTGTFAFLQSNATDARIGGTRLTASGSFIPLTFYTSNTERMRIDTSGRLGIGTTSPSSALHVAGGSGSTIRNTASSGSSWFVGSNIDSYILHNESNTPMVFTTNGTEKMRISSGGLVGIGTSGPAGILDVNGTGSGASTNWILLRAGNTGGTTFPGLAAGLAIGNNFSNGQSETNLVWGQSVGSQQYLSISKWTGSAVTEQMRITSGGNVAIGSSSLVGNEQVNISFNSAVATTTQALNTKDTNAAGSGTYHYVMRRSDDTYLGGLRRVGTDNAMGVDGNAYLSLQTAGTERMRIDSSGNVGIGTSSPASFGKFAVLQTSGSVVAQFATTTNGAGTYIIANNSAGTDHWSYGGYANYGATGAFHLSLSTNSSERMRIDSSGNVGIGTSGPSARLHILSPTDETIRLATSTVNPYLSFYEGTSRRAYIQYAAGGGGLIIDSEVASQGIVFNTQNAERMRITSGGSLLIGTTTGGNNERLAVIGGNGIFCRTQYNITSTPTTIAQGTGLLLLLRDDGNGTTALVLYENANSPVIISQVGPTRFVTGAPSGTQIQLTNRSGNVGVAAQMASGQSTTLNVCVISCDAN